MNKKFMVLLTLTATIFVFAGCSSRDDRKAKLVKGLGLPVPVETSQTASTTQTTQTTQTTDSNAESSPATKSDINSSSTASGSIFVSGDSGTGLASGSTSGSTSATGNNSDLVNNGSWWKRIWKADGSQEAVLAPGIRVSEPVNGDGTLASISSSYIPQTDINGHYEAGLLIGERIVQTSEVPAGSLVTGVIGEYLNDKGITVSVVGTFYFPDGGFITNMGSYVLREPARLAPTSLFVTSPEASALDLESKWTQYTNASAQHAFYKCVKVDGKLPVVDAITFYKTTK